MACNTRTVVEKVLDGQDLDSSLVDYIVGVMDDDDFEFGDDGQDAFDAIGHLLIDSGAASDNDGALDLCRKMKSLLQDPQSQSQPQSSTTNGNSTFSRALQGGPLKMNDVSRDNGGTTLMMHHAVSGKKLIQGVFKEGEEDDSFSLMSDKDQAKIKKLQEKQERQARAAFETHQKQAEQALQGQKITLLRNMGGPAVRDIHLENFSVSNGGAELVTDATVLLAFGRRYGLIGKNGIGKSSFLRALTSGEIAGIPKNCQVLHVEQEVVGDEESALQTVLSCDVERDELLAKEKQLLADMSSDDNHSKEGDLAKELEKVSARLLEIDAATAESRASSILAGLAFTPEMQHRKTREFSGGWRMRIALARALFVQPTLLLLDEPTNHLDLHAVLWLQEYLLTWKNTLVVVSHARHFLNAVCTDILHLHSKKIVAYRGNYDTFEKTSTERLRNAKAAAESTEARRKHMQGFIDKFRFNAKRAALVQSRIKAIERLADVEQFEDEPEIKFHFPDPPDMPSAPIISFKDVSFQYPGQKKLMFRKLNFGIDLDSRLSVVGPNGAGKTTLLKLISGDLEETGGIIERNPKIRIAIFSQHFVDSLDLALTALGLMSKSFPRVKEPELRAHLSNFGITQDLAAQPLYTLSGGQKSRVALAKLTWTKPHILLLDEPSNHLDMQSIDALAAGLLRFKGGVLMVSHDQHLIESSVEEMWGVEDDGSISVFHGTFDEYIVKLMKK